MTFLTLVWQESPKAQDSCGSGSVWEQLSSFPSLMDTATFISHLSVPLLLAFQQTLSEAAEKCLKEKCGLWSWGGQGGWEKGWQWKGNGKRISARTWSPRLRGKKNKSAEQDRQHRETWAVKEMSYKGLRGLSRFCSIQENTDMSKTRLEDKERFVPKPIYIYPVWHSQLELNTVFILIRSNFYINKIIFLRRIFCWFFASLGVKTVQIWAVLVSAAKLIELIECWIPKIYKTFVPHLFCRNLGANRILN